MYTLFYYDVINHYAFVDHFVVSATSNGFYTKKFSQLEGSYCDNFLLANGPVVIHRQVFKVFGTYVMNNSVICVKVSSS